jgi:hypothetical protein
LPCNSFGSSAVASSISTEEVTTLGTALAQGRMPPGIALTLVNQIAPGCIDAVYFSLYEGVSPEQLTDVFEKEVA